MYLAPSRSGDSTDHMKPLRWRSASGSSSSYKIGTDGFGFAATVRKKLRTLQADRQQVLRLKRYDSRMTMKVRPRPFGTASI